MTSIRRKIRTVIVDDSPFMRKIIADVLQNDDAIQVIATAKNGKQAIETIIALKPDVVTMDIEMPVMDGLEALKTIMQKYPVPVIMLSSLTHHGAEATITALELGAVDFIQKPSSLFHMQGENLKIEMIQKIKAAYQIKVEKNHEVLREVGIEKNTAAVESPKINSTKTKNIIAVGTSTGGPRALQSIIPQIPQNFPGSFLIVQHMPAGFTKSLAQRLNSISAVTVKEAEESEEVLPAHVYIAPGNYHLKVKKSNTDKLLIHLSQEQAVLGHRPAADVLFHSLAEMNFKHMNITGVIMTGMGSDGANGLKELKTKKLAYIIAQDEASCVVYGMPKSAVKAGIVDKIVPLKEIIDIIVKRVGVL
ncbi:protein-glutamate methylesterase/protein-glutamine glutaminase [Clostridium formicaceticum]|uniref:Protein-glutamate methylesterase/protein-glutamine glutaminase n=1 Tax=Clostridium formicaceticum TaxID=1497 RepID=A0AAC9WHM5_9CLOT|nr:chemotaxis response regulator protein-glutamate methylesterase [Clostridium formicaceticum]AOY77297.1 chemotaxis response regulator protein-glutamate methylesterase [Clostridium formicaceticum]ARE87840.1 Chemotaxis response regulator protein-glutamate methylesterase [Clostridium formicaceticum]